MKGYIVANTYHSLCKSPEVIGVICDEEGVIWSDKQIAEDIAAEARKDSDNEGINVFEVNC